MYSKLPLKKEEREKIFMITEKETPDMQTAQAKLFLKQKETLDLFLARGAISQQQYDETLKVLREKMNL